MNARCIDCDAEIETDEWTFVSEPYGSVIGERMCLCPGDSRCQGDDLRADDAHNDPRRGQAADINRRSER